MQNPFIPKMPAEEIQRQNAKLREITGLAERFGCTPSQLAIAWSLKNEHVHSVLIGAISTEQLYEHLQALQVCAFPPLKRYLCNILMVHWYSV